MLKVVLAGVCLVSMVGCVSNHATHEAIGCDPDAYRAVLDEIIESDQHYRLQITWNTTDMDEIEQLKGFSLEEEMAEQARRKQEGIALEKGVLDELWEKQIEIDRANTNELMRWVQECGWPSEETLGEGIPSMVPVLIHMQMEEAQWVLPMLRVEVLEGRMPPKPYAMIYDRKQQHEGKPQLYGMMQAFDAETRTILAPAIVDVDATNDARMEIGMDPIEEFRVTDIDTAAGK